MSNVYIAISKQVSYQLICSRILPFLLPICAEKNLQDRQFTSLIDAIKVMITSVENDRKQEFEKEVALRKEMEVSTPANETKLGRFEDVVQSAYTETKRPEPPSTAHIVPLQAESKLEEMVFLAEMSATRKARTQSSSEQNAPASLASNGYAEGNWASFGDAQFESTLLKPVSLALDVSTQVNTPHNQGPSNLRIPIPTSSSQCQPVNPPGLQTSPIDAMFSSTIQPSTMMPPNPPTNLLNPFPLQPSNHYQQLI